MVKKCTPLWREAHFEVKSFKNWRTRTTFRSWDVEKAHAIVARSTFQVKSVKHWGARSTFGRSDVVLRGRRKGLCTLSRVSKTWGFCSSFKSVGRRGTFEDDLQRCIFRGRRSTRDMFSRDVRRSGRWFPERGCILEHQIFRFAKMICVTGAALRMTWHHFLVAGAALYTTLHRWNGKIAKRIGTRPPALHSTFHFWRKFCRIALFLMLSTSKHEGMSQNTVPNPGCLTRGYDSGYDSWVWFVGMIRGPWFSVSLHPPRMVIYPHLPRKCFNCW